MTYAEETDIEGMIAQDITTGSVPTSDQLAIMLTNADSIINAHARSSTNMTDTYGLLKTIASNLVYKMVNNAWALIKPREYGPMIVELSEEDKMLIKLAHSKWTAHSFDVGE